MSSRRHQRPCSSGARPAHATQLNGLGVSRPVKIQASPCSKRSMRGTWSRYLAGACDVQRSGGSMRCPSAEISRYSRAGVSVSVPLIVETLLRRLTDFYRHLGDDGVADPVRAQHRLAVLQADDRVEPGPLELLRFHRLLDVG